MRKNTSASNGYKHKQHVLYMGSKPSKPKPKPKTPPSESPPSSEPDIVQSYNEARLQGVYRDYKNGKPILESDREYCVDRDQAQSMYSCVVQENI